jgi:hypothetical protein
MKKEDLQRFANKHRELHEIERGIRESSATEFEDEIPVSSPDRFFDYFEQCNEQVYGSMEKLFNAETDNEVFFSRYAIGAAQERLIVAPTIGQLSLLSVPPLRRDTGPPRSNKFELSIAYATEDVTSALVTIPANLLGTYEPEIIRLKKLATAVMPFDRAKLFDGVPAMREDVEKLRLIWEDIAET